MTIRRIRRSATTWSATSATWGLSWLQPAAGSMRSKAEDRARKVLEQVGAAHPTLRLVSADRAWFDLDSGINLTELGRNEEALATLERARVAREAQREANPSVPRYAAQLALIHRRVGVIHRRAGRTAEALASYELAREFAEPLATADPGNTDFQLDLAEVFAEIGEILGAMGRSSEALASFNKAIGGLTRRGSSTSWSRPTHRRPRIGPTWPARFGAAGLCTGGAAGLWRRFPTSACRPTCSGRLANPSLEDLYRLSCSHALLSGVADRPGSGLSAAEGRVEADAAMVALRRAVDGGWQDVSGARHDSDLDPIRSRPDFRLLMLDLEFPTDPFAHQITPRGK